MDEQSYGFKKGKTFLKLALLDIKLVVFLAFMMKKAPTLSSNQI